MNSKQIWELELPVDEEQETPLSLKQAQETIGRLVEKGLVAPTGELRRAPDGNLYPVYALTIYGNHLAILEKQKRRIN
jgi:hypothetical protein